MATETKIQALVHKLDEGGWAKWIKTGALLSAILAVCYLWLWHGNGFKGIAHPRVFEQAGIAREIARGNGFSTKIYRPAALFQFRQFKGLDVEHTPDTYHAPLWPTVIAPAIWMVRSTWEMTTKDVLYESDRVIAILATFFFLLSVLVNYFLARRLFDSRLAIISVGLLLLCDHLWQFSMSGLPQMFMLFLFSCAMYAVLRAIEAYESDRLVAADAAFDATIEEEFEMGEDSPPHPVSAPSRGRFSPLVWLAVAALFFGLLALTHAITIWIFAGLLVFCLIYFRPRGLYAGVMLAIFLVCYTPWLVRTYRVCGNPAGVAWYSALMHVKGTESSIMRSMDPPLSGVSPALFRRKLAEMTDRQFSGLYGYLGGVVAAPFFFIALLHLFRRRPIAVFRWCILACWLAAVFGMSVIGLDDQVLGSNDLHVLFIPLMTFYGLAFILVLWSRLEIRVKLARVAFMIMLFVITARAFAVSFLDLLGQPSQRVQWPPYIPPFIAIMANWTLESEVIMSDMPWAVAWYADRRSLWLPTGISDFTNLNDWDVLHGKIVGLYLTPISGYSPFLADIVKGEYKEWAPFIMRTVNLRNFPLKEATIFTKDAECIFYADRNRWTSRED